MIRGRGQVQYANIGPGLYHEFLYRITITIITHPPLSLVAITVKSVAMTVKSGVVLILTIGSTLCLIVLAPTQQPLHSVLDPH